MRLLVVGIIVVGLAVLVVLEILVSIRADSRREQLRAQEWEQEVDKRLKRYGSVVERKAQGGEQDE